MRFRLPFAVLLFFSFMVLIGCKDQYEGRKEVFGSVKLVNEPLKAGSIRFVPLDKQGTENGSEIKDGEYRLPRKDGLKPGKYQVQITAGDGKTPANEEAGEPGGSTNIVSVDMVPEDWNVKSKQTIEVKADGDNKHDFHIPTKNTARKKAK